jgi:hypothetical protein
MMEVSDLFQATMNRPRRMFRMVYGLSLAVMAAALFLYVTLTAWSRFLFVPSEYSPDLRLILAMGRMLLLSGGSIFGIIATRISRASGQVQLLVCCISVSCWLFPYGFVEGSFLPIVPLAGAVIASSGAYLAHRMNSAG